MSDVVKLRKTALTGCTSCSQEPRPILSNLSLFCSQDILHEVIEEILSY